MIAFAVDDVDAVTDFVPTATLAELFPDALVAGASDPATRGLIVDGAKCDRARVCRTPSAREGALEYPNPMLDLPIDEPRDIASDDVMGYRGPGLRTDSVPATLSRVIVNINDQIRANNRTVALHAGLIGVGQDEGCALRPLAGWYLAPAQIEIEDVLDRIVRDHQTTAPQPARLMFETGELQALYRRVGSASLFGGAWRLMPASDLRGAPRGAHTLKLVPILRTRRGPLPRRRRGPPWRTAPLGGRTVRRSPARHVRSAHFPESSAGR